MDEAEEFREEKSLSSQDTVSHLDRFTSSSMMSSRNCVATISGDSTGGGRNVICCSVDRGNVAGRGVFGGSSEVLDDDFFFLGLGNVFGGAFP